MSDTSGGIRKSDGQTTFDVLRRGWKASPELRKGAALTLLLALIGAGGQSVLPILIQQMLDRGLVEGKMQPRALGVLGGLGFLLVTGTAVASWSTRKRLVRAGEDALCTLRTNAFRHIHKLSLATQTDERRGALVARVTSDVEQLSQFLSWGGMSWLVNTAIILSVAVIMAVYDWRLALVAIVVVLPMVLVLNAVQHKMASRYNLVRTRMAELLTAVSETVMGAPVIRAYEAEAATRERAVGAIVNHRKAQIRAGWMSAALFPSGELFSVLTVASVLVVGVWLGPSHGLTAGEVVAFIFLVNLFLQPVAEFTDIVDQTQTAVAGWRRILDLLETPVDLPDPVPGVTLAGGAPEIILDDVWFRYRETGELVLHGISAKIAAGSTIALVGATGSGKTTLAKLLARLADPTEGRVLVGGVDLRDVAASSLRRTLVMVPQEGFLFDTTVGDNVRFGRPEASDDELLAAFADLGLDGWLDGLANGLATPVGERGDSLSVGERQLVSLARAYLANPACLILDEATSAVDPATEVRLARAVDSLTEGRTTIAIAHRLSTAERADQILVMDGGRLVESGTHADLVSAGGVYGHLHDRWLDVTGTITAG
ncbi:MAG: ATP-binding cassette, subfamily bacterial [Actinomycetota bacterium]|jgi:putative ABC transport system ATP-binding protein|nr:ATP-binding cassette, subfamily bacterial [Actinomycetota bacterium]